MLSQYALLTIMSDNESSDEEWYARMEAEGAKNDDNIHAVSITNSQENEPAAAELSDDAYFTMIETHGSTLVDGSFRSESDIVWQSMLRSAVRGKVNETKIDELRELNQNDFSSVSMCQQWLFGFLPKSSKQFMDLDLFMNYLDDNHKLYTDDAAHPSIVVSIWTKYGGNRIEVSLFSPFSVQELRSVVPLLFNTLDKVRQISGLEDVMFCGLDVMLYESSIAINKNNLEEQWVENCGMLICESSHTQKKTFESSSCEDDKYFIDTLWCNLLYQFKYL